MKHILILITTLSLISCKQNNGNEWGEACGIYFQAGGESSFSFTMTQEDKFTYEIPVMLMGRISGEDRKFKIMVVDTSTTAIAGVHYDRLQEEYILPANSHTMNLPIVLHSTDDLKSGIVKLGLRIVENDHFYVVSPVNGSKILFVTNQISKPSYWDASLQTFYGVYSQTKHKILVERSGKDFPAQYDGATNWHRIQGRNASLYFAINTVYDENDNLIESWVI